MVQLIPLQPSARHHQHGNLKIVLKPGEAKVGIFDHDAIITKKIGGETFEALITTRTVGEGLRFVPAAYAGKTDDRVILYLPTSNNGRPTWVFPEAYLDDILVKY